MLSVSIFIFVAERLFIVYIHLYTKSFETKQVDKAHNGVADDSRKRNGRRSPYTHLNVVPSGYSKMADTSGNTAVFADVSAILLLFSRRVTSQYPRGTALPAGNPSLASFLFSYFLSRLVSVIPVTAV